MSCLSCPCHFKWPLDSMGLKRDPVNCEKAWLDFAVRHLSREAVGKGRGQETVWSSKCQPCWWDRKVAHPWKNPTANPKDTKEVLLEKFEALESHLRAENRFPVELEEESRLWKDGKYRELFLMTSLTSLLGKVATVHTAIEDACVKVKDLKASVHHSILTNIQNCLTSSLKCTEQLKCGQSSTNTSHSGPKTQIRKRNLVSSYLEKENLKECPPAKLSKSETKETCNLGSDLDCRQDLGPHSHRNSDNSQPNDILAFAQKLLAKRKSNPHKSLDGTSRRPSSNQKPHREILPKTTSLVASHIPKQQNVLKTVEKVLVLKNTEPAANNTSLISWPGPVTVTPEQLDFLLSQNTLITQSSSGSAQPTIDNNTNNMNAITTEHIDHSGSYPNFSFVEASLPHTSPSPDVNEIENFSGADSHPVRLEPSRDNPNFTQPNACTSVPLTFVPETLGNSNESTETDSLTDLNPNSKCPSLVGSCSTPFPSSPSEFDLSIFDDLDLDKVCSELFTESLSRCINTTQTQSQLSHGTNELTTSFYRAEENPNTNISTPSVQVLEESVGNQAHFIPDLTHFPDAPQTFPATSSPDMGYCSESSSPGNSAGVNPMLEVCDLDSSLLLETFFSSTENPFSSDLH